ncbi:hypothetical protein [Arthrobacter sp. UYP6]|uniref:hypothetical protein n=1 Tax=Arthrobacter sp. UYP6 TaxID=1756378 RepID=UPI003390A3A7
MFDPLLLRNKDLALGWFLGVKNVDHSEMLGDLFRALSKEFSFSGRDAHIYASSGGGLPALRIATQLPHVSVYLTNVQTDPRRYYPKFYKQMTKVAFAGMSEEEIDRRYGERLSSYAWDGDFHLTYAQNLADQFHYLRHFVPYLQAQARSINQLKTLEFVTYDDPVSGHGVLPRATELAIIEAMHHRLPIAELLPKGRMCDADHRKKALVHG